MISLTAKSSLKVIYAAFIVCCSCQVGPVHRRRVRPSPFGRALTYAIPPCSSDGDSQPVPTGGPALRCGGTAISMRPTVSERLPCFIIDADSLGPPCPTTAQLPCVSSGASSTWFRELTFLYAFSGYCGGCQDPEMSVQDGVRLHQAS